MKVVFTSDVPNVARTGDIKEVADGYGKNYLIPHKLAVLASPEALNAVKAQLESEARSRAQTRAELEEIAGNLEGKEILLEAKAGAKDRLYGSITSADIADGLKKGTGLKIDKRKIELEQPIRQVGDYEVTVRLASDLVPKIKVKVNKKAEE